MNMEMQMKCVSSSIIPFMIQIEDWLQIGDFMVFNDLANKEDDPPMDSSPLLSHDFRDKSAHLQNIALIIDHQAARYCGESRQLHEQECGPGSSAMDTVLYSFKVPVSCI